MTGDCGGVVAEVGVWDCGHKYTKLFLNLIHLLEHKNVRIYDAYSRVLVEPYMS